LAELIADGGAQHRSGAFDRNLGLIFSKFRIPRYARPPE
jgi:hypothetical protein